MIPYPTFLVCCGFYCDLESSDAYGTGYHAETSNIHFVAITPPPLTSVPLFDLDLNILAERAANLVHMIRLSGVVAWLGEQLHRRDKPEFVEFDRYVPSLIS